MDVNDVTGAIIGAAIRVHRELGPGLLESSYEACLCYELSTVGLEFERQMQLPLIYKGRPMQVGYRMDLVVEGVVIVELKSVERIERIHVATVLTYLRLSHYTVALLINFHSTILKDGIRRIILQSVFQSLVLIPPRPVAPQLRSFGTLCIRPLCALSALW